jgi:hypothetical protein
MKNNNESDEIRAWFERREFGDLSKTYPFQSAILNASLNLSLNNSYNEDIIEHYLEAFCSSLSEENEYFELNEENNIDDIVVNLLPNCQNCDFNSISTYPKSLEQGIDFCNDLLTSSLSIEVNQSCNNQQGQDARNYENVDNTVASSNVNKSDHSNNNDSNKIKKFETFNNIHQPNEKSFRNNKDSNKNEQNIFKTAKDIYIIEEKKVFLFFLFFLFFF